MPLSRPRFYDEGRRLLPRHTSRDGLSRHDEPTFSEDRRKFNRRGLEPRVDIPLRALTTTFEVMILHGREQEKDAPRRHAESFKKAFESTSAKVKKISKFF